jgi:hypothetical protein
MATIFLHFFGNKKIRQDNLIENIFDDRRGDNMYEYHFQILFEGGYVFGESWW